MDIRDFYWWERKGRVANVRKKIDTLGMARLSMHGDESYDRQVRDLVDQIELWEFVKPTDDQVLTNWNARMAELKAIVKRR